MKLRVQELIDNGEKLFSQRLPLVALWQDIADNFYPERADFTTSRALGADFAAHLMTGYPTMARRDLANQFNAMLRPRGKEWFTLVPDDARLAEQRSVLDWSKWATGNMRRAMYDPWANFVRATKEGDNDFAAFGQAVLTVEADLAHSTLLYRCWHLRDVVWHEDDRGKIIEIHRKWKPTVRDLVRRYGNKVPARVRECLEKEPHKTFDCRHIVVPYSEYDISADKKPKNESKFKFVSIYVMKDECAILDETPVIDHDYIIPRWQTVSGSQYAHSPCTVIALPDARLLQRISYTLIEAGEKATNPAMLAVKEALRSDVGTYAGAITWVDAEYDERLGEVLRPLAMDKSGLSFGVDMTAKLEDLIKAAFYLNQITLPAMDGAAMTATEIRARTEEYIRAALPLFEPMETEYNGAVCEKTFNILLAQGVFGSEREWPRELVNVDLKWQFESPISQAGKREDANTFQEAAQLLAIASKIDPGLMADYDAREHFRRAMISIDAPMIDKRIADDASAAQQGMAEVQKIMGMVGQGAQTVEQVGKAAQVIGPMMGQVDPAAATGVPA